MGQKHQSENENVTFTFLCFNHAYTFTWGRLKISFGSSSLFLNTTWFLWFQRFHTIATHTPLHSIFPLWLRSNRWKCSKCACTWLWLIPNVPVHLVHMFHTLVATLQVMNKWVMLFSCSPHITQLSLFRNTPLYVLN